MNTERFETPFFIGLLLLALALAFFVFLPELSIIVLALTFAILFRPIYAKLNKQFGHHSGIAAFLTVVLAIVIIFAPLAFFGLQIFQEAQGLYVRIALGGSVPFLGFVQAKLNTLAPSLSASLDQYVTQALGDLVNRLGTILSQLANVVWVFFLSLFAFYYLLKDGAHLGDAIVKVIPLPEHHTRAILGKLEDMASSVVRGSLLVAVAYGILMGLGFWVFGLSNPVLWGALSIVLALIPVVGILLIAVPAIGFLVLSGSIGAAIGFTIWIFCIGIIMESLLRPRLIGRRAKVHPLLLLLSVLGGLALFGAMGILLGPLALSLLLALFEIYPEVALARH